MNIISEPQGGVQSGERLITARAVSDSTPPVDVVLKAIAAQLPEADGSYKLVFYRLRHAAGDVRGDVTSANARWRAAIRRLEQAGLIEERGKSVRLTRRGRQRLKKLGIVERRVAS